MIVYKLTDENMQTYGGFQYAIGVKAEATGRKRTLCTNGLLHAYEHPLLAVLHNPIHAYFKSPRLFKAETNAKVVREGFLKLGVRSMTLIEELPLPELTVEHKVRYAIGCSLAVYRDPQFV